jgi:hypothetical protein
LLVLDDNQSVVEHPPKTRVADNRSVFVFIYTKVTMVYAWSITYFCLPYHFTLSAQ